MIEWNKLDKDEKDKFDQMAILDYNRYQNEMSDLLQFGYFNMADGTKSCDQVKTSSKKRKEVVEAEENQVADKKSLKKRVAPRQMEKDEGLTGSSTSKRNRGDKQQRAQESPTKDLASVRPKSPKSKPKSCSPPKSPSAKSPVISRPKSPKATSTSSRPKSPKPNASKNEKNLKASSK